MNTISLVVPCYNEQEALPKLMEEIYRIISLPHMNDHTYEILLVDDGSKDGTLALMRDCAKADDRVRYLSFSRNFGKEAAMLAGLRYAKGDIVAIMDADMQDPPSLLPEMLRILETGEYDCVATRRSNRAGEPPIRSFLAKSFYRFINKISDADIMDGARDFRLMRRKVVDAILELGEYNRFSKGIFGWVGFKTYWLAYDNVERVAGQTKWSVWQLVKYSIEGIVNFSQTPLSLSSLLGILFTVAAVLLIVVEVVRWLVYGDPVAGWPSLVCLILLVSGIQFFCIGIMGQYISKMYLEVKHRPVFIITETEESVHRTNEEGQK